MNILTLSTFPPRRCGIGDHTADLASELATYEELQVQVLTYGDGAAGEKHAENGIEVSRQLGRRTSTSFIGRLLRENEADLVHLQSSAFLHHPSVNTALSRACDVPLVTTVHDTPGSWRIFHAIPSLRKVYRKSSRLITHAIGVSETLVEFHGTEEAKIVRIPLGVDTHRYHPGVDENLSRSRYDLGDNRIVLFFGFLRPGKGLETLMEAWRRIAHLYADAVLLIAGGLPSQTKRYGLGLHNESSYPRRLREFARRLGVAGKVIFTGYVPEELVPSLLAAAEIVVLPYTGSPSQSGPLHKALSCGKPVIGTRVPGFTELLTENKDCILVPPGDAKALADSISSLMDDSTLRHSLGRRARRKAERELDLSAVARETLRIYLETLDS